VPVYIKYTHTMHT